MHARGINHSMFSCQEQDYVRETDRRMYSYCSEMIASSSTKTERQRPYSSNPTAGDSNAYERTSPYEAIDYYTDLQQQAEPQRTTSTTHSPTLPPPRNDDYLQITM